MQEAARRLIGELIGELTACSEALRAPEGAETWKGGGFPARSPDELSATDASGNAFLLQLFNPEASTRRLFDTGFGFLRGESVGAKLVNGVGQLFRSFSSGRWSRSRRITFVKDPPLEGLGMIIAALRVGARRVAPAHAAPDEVPLRW